MKKIFLTIAALLIIIPSFAEESVTVTIFKYYNTDSSPKYNYLTGIITDTAASKISENKNINYSIKPYNTKVIRILNNPEQMIEELDFLANVLESDFIILGMYDNNETNQTTIIRTYIYNRNNKSIDELKTFSGNIGADFSNTIYPLSDATYEHIIDNFDFYKNTPKDKINFAGCYSFVNGWTLSLNYGKLYFTDDWGDYFNDTNIFTSELMYDFFLDGCLKETPILNVSSVGIRYTYFDAESKSTQSEKRLTYFHGVSAVYNFLFRPFSFLNIRFELSAGTTKLKSAVNPSMNTQYETEDMTEFFYSAAAGADFIAGPIVFKFNSGLMKMDLKDSPSMDSYYFSGGVGFRF